MPESLPTTLLQFYCRRTRLFVMHRTVNDSHLFCLLCRREAYRPYQK